MADLIVNNTTFNYPDPGAEPGWGEDATGWAKAVTDALASLAPAGTLNEAQSAIDNNQTNEEVSGLLFSFLLTKTATVLYRIERDTDAMSPLVEQGYLYILYDNGTWLISREISAGTPAGVQLDIDSNGQVIYTSTNLAGASYTGFIKFKTFGIVE